eukprot:3664518-Pleurochrysis_carterae.AAC.1
MSQGVMVMLSKCIQQQNAPRKFKASPKEESKEEGEKKTSKSDASRKTGIRIITNPGVREHSTACRKSVASDGVSSSSCTQ